MPGVMPGAGGLAQRWIVLSGGRFDVACWTFGAVVFDEGTGEMMVLGAAQSAIIQALKVSCMTIDELAQFLFGQEREESDVNDLDVALRNLQAMGLVRAE